VSFIKHGSTAAGATTPDVIVTMNLQSGVERQIVRSTQQIQDYTWKPGGSQLAYLLVGSVVVVNPTTGVAKTIRRLPPESQVAGRAGYEDESAIWWSPDGRHLLVTDTYTSPPSQVTIWILRPDGSDAVGPIDGTFGRWAEGGKVVYYKALGSGLPWYSLSIADGTRTPLPVREDALSPLVGPDGRSLVYNDTKPDGVVYVFDATTGIDRRIASGFADPIWLSQTEIAVTHAVPCTRGVDCSVPWDERPGTVGMTTAGSSAHPLRMESTTFSDRYPELG
jgi:hypothetical protein